MKKFIWNNSGVCINANARKYKNSHASLIVLTAKHAEKWYYGYEIRMVKGTERNPIQCSCKLPDLKLGPFKTEHDALKYLLERFKKEYFKNPYYHDDNPYYRDLIKKFEVDIMQLKLF